MSLSRVFQALREPEAFSAAHARPAPAQAPVAFGLSPSDLRLFGALSATAAFGVAAYGAALHGYQGAGAMLAGGLGAAAAAGGAWATTLPALYVLGTLKGSPLSARALLLGSLVTVSFGGLAMLASVPVLSASSSVEY